MSRRPKQPKRLSWIELYKSVRKKATPPGRTIQPKDRDLADEEDERELQKWQDWRGEPYEEFEE